MTFDRQLLGDLYSRINEIFGLATIISHTGSTPRSVGTRMALTTDHKIIGTIGGGKLEAEIIHALESAIETKTPRILNMDFSGADAASLDMICGGSVRVLVEAVAPSRSDFWQAVEALKNRVASHLVIKLIPGAAQYDARIDLLSNVSTDVKNLINSLQAPQVIETGEGVYFVEPVENQITLHIFGAGHVAQALANLTHTVDFRTNIYDDRIEFANRDRFPDADEIIVIRDVERVLLSSEIKPLDYIVIVTRGHLHDKVFLEKSLKTVAGYIGMIGSRRKNKLVFDELRQKGFSEADLERVHAPIGIDIKAETPEEIAVSILAELILHRARRQHTI